MTALLVLEDHPLLPGQSGPILTVTANDVATYYNELNGGESVLPVTAGERISEYQLLEGLMLPSASNFAAILADWDAGSASAFVNRMNARATALGMTATHYADASGFSSRTVSIPNDLVTLARTAMQVPVFAEIVAQPRATLPVAGLIHNLDVLLGRNGVIGIKTGNTDQAGGCLVFAADYSVAGRSLRIYGAVLGQPNSLAGAFAATTALLSAAQKAFQVVPIVANGQVVARYSTAWGESGAIVSAASASWLLLDGTTVNRKATVASLPASLPARSRVGMLSLVGPNRQDKVSLVTSAAINGPDLGWRLTRGF
jgi:D-alanyl-D-alanine carboxypeptidase (penicillin-binding protein 5/6)